MPFVRCLVTLICVLALAHPAASGQHLKKLQCPKPARERRHLPPPVTYLELSAGLSKPFMYRNEAGGTGDHFRFSSLFSPYAAATGHVILNDRLGVFAGMVLTESWQGLAFRYEDAGTRISTKGYAGSFIIRMPLGITYRLSALLRLSVAPYIAYSTHSGSQESAGSAGTGAHYGSYYHYEAPEYKNRVNAGLNVAMQIRLTKRLGADLGFTVDGGRSAASYGNADPDGGSGNRSVYQGAVKPYLLYTGAGLSYKLWDKGE